MSRAPTRVRLAWSLLWGLPVLSACTGPQPRSSDTVVRAVSPDPLLPGIDPRTKPDVMADEFDRLARSGRSAFAALSARRWYPEAVAASATAATEQGRGAIASALDALGTATAPRGGHLDLDAQRTDAYVRREGVLTCLGRGDLEGARELVPIDVTGASMRTQIEAQALSGFVLRASGDAAAARAEFVAAARSARDSGWTWHEARAWLLASDDAALNRAPAADGEPAWLNAVAAGLRFVDRATGIDDPLFWERAIAARGEHVWSDDAIIALCRAYDVPLDEELRAAEDPDELVRLCVGGARLRRGEAVAALLALRVVEERARTPRVRAWAALGQARALIAVGRMGEGRTILAVSIELEDEVVRSTALGQLGALELAEQRPERAAGLLGRAVEIAGNPIEFPARGEALANLGLALLSTQRDAEGLERLREAQARFEERRDLEGMHLVLANELEVARSSGPSQDVERIAALLRDVESGSR